MSRHSPDRPHHLFLGLRFGIPVAVVLWGVLILVVHVAVSGRI